jgi:hypothetical protein
MELDAGIFREAVSEIIGDPGGLSMIGALRQRSFDPKHPLRLHQCDPKQRLLHRFTRSPKSKRSS